MRARFLLISSVVVAIVPVAIAAIGMNVPSALSAAYFRAGPESYNSEVDPAYLSVTGLGCFSNDIQREADLLDGAVAKVGVETARRYADYTEAVAKGVAGSKAGREHILSIVEGQRIRSAPWFSERRRGALREWGALRAFLLGLEATQPEPLLPGEDHRFAILDAALQANKCPRAVARLRKRIDRVETLVRMNRVRNVLHKFSIDLGVFPDTDVLGLKGLLEPSSESDLAGKWKGPYLHEEDLVDAWGKELSYSDLSRGQMYSLTSFGVDGLPGGLYDDTDIVFSGSVPTQEAESDRNDAIAP